MRDEEAGELRRGREGKTRLWVFSERFPQIVIEGK